MKPKILLLDIETSPIVSYTWGLWDQNIGLNQIKEDWYILSCAYKWLGEKKVHYTDQRNAKPMSNDKRLLKTIWKVLDECDGLITQNGISFDEKKLNARFILNGMTPPSPYKSIDTLRLARKRFGFTSNKLAFLAQSLGAAHEKLEHREFGGFELWRECLAGNKRAWDEMEKYNKLDVLALEDVYNKLAPWGLPINYAVHSEVETPTCNCGSTNLTRRGYNLSKTGKFARFQCKECGAWYSSKENLLPKSVKKSLLKGI